MHFGIFEAILSVFFTALIVSVLFRQLKLSVILGYLVVGALVGPNMLALVPNSDYINNLAEFGIVFLMFTVGLEFSLSKLIALRKTVFIVGGLQVLLCVLITTLVGMAIGMSLIAAVVIGGIVAMSSTALVVKQLNDQFELQSQHGIKAVGILLFQDLAFVPLIILIASLAKGSHGLLITLLWSLCKGIVAIALIFILGRWLLRPLFHFIARARTIELFTLSVLLVALSAAWITHILGLSFALGAFLGGVMLAETEFRHQIEVEIRPFRDILLALFFISIGMLAQIQSWLVTWHWIVLLLLALIVGKMLLIIILSRITGSFYSTATRTGIVLAQGGEFSFALLNIAMQGNMMPPDYQQVVLAALLISIGISPLLIRFNKQIAEFFLPKSSRLTESINQREIVRQAKKLKDHVIICGYGRVGQHIARMLDKIQFPYIGLDFDAELVKRASLAGDNVLFGDATNPEIMRKAGINHAKVLVICLSDFRAAIKILSLVRQRYPQLPILVRCHDKTQLKQLKKMGATQIIAELFETSLTLSHHLLQLTQISPEKISQIIKDVRDSDYELLQKVFAGTNTNHETDDIEGTLKEEAIPIVIPENAYAVNRSISELHFTDISVDIVSIRRGQETFTKPPADSKIQPNDIVVLFGTINNLEVAERRLLEGE